MPALQILCTSTSSIKENKSHTNTAYAPSYITALLATQSNIPHHIVNAASLNVLKILLDCSWSTVQFV